MPEPTPSSKVATLTPELEHFLPFRIHRLAARLGYTDVFRTKFGAHIRVREWRVLFLLRARDGLSNAEICALLGMDPATVSRAVNALADQGLAATATAPDDGRKILSTLTAKGRAAYKEIAPARLAFAEAVESCLSPPERVALYALLDKLDRRCAELKT